MLLRLPGVFASSWLASLPGFRPGIALDENLAVGRHARLGKPDRSLQLELDSDDLLDTILAEVRVFGRERGLRINPGNIGLDRLVRDLNRDKRARLARL